MSLRDLELHSAYRSGRDLLTEEFYVPCLQEATSYDRAVGYFSSTLFQVLALAFSDFAKRGGRMRLICSPALTPDDFQAMKDGMTAAQRAQESVRADLDMLMANPTAVPATRLLATLVAFGIIDVRIAFSDDPAGLFHDKIGIFEDADGRRVSFMGSANETWRAWGLNHESFDISCSWRNEPELLRTRQHADMFREIWHGREPGVRVERLDNVTSEQLKSISHEHVDAAIEAVRTHRSMPSAVGKRELMEHQRLVLQNWADRSYRGIVNFATGAGKTITAIEAVRQWTAQGGAALILVPGRDLHEQWIRELERQLPEGALLPAGAGANKTDWLRLLPIYTGPATASDRPRVTVATNQTFASADFQRRVKQGDHLLIVVDEMHRAGSATVLPALEQTRCGATLGLSATYARQFDSDGTARLLRFFGPVLDPVIGLAEALALGLLVPYDYRLHEVELTDSESEEYDRLTRRIGQLVARGEALDDPNSSLQMLLIKRARVLKQASQKVPMAVQLLIQEYQDGDRWLVYCDDQEQLRMVVRDCLAASLPVLEFHSEMESDRAAVISSLSNHGGIVVAIRCLDEGIDIPVTDHALIVASSTVEREYVQRRGRVLRRAEEHGKVSAEVHDLILVNEAGGALTKGEALRALEFVRLSRNPAARDRLMAMIALSRDLIELPHDLYLGEEGD